MLLVKPKITEINLKVAHRNEEDIPGLSCVRARVIWIKPKGSSILIKYPYIRTSASASVLVSTLLR